MGSEEINDLLRDVATLLAEGRNFERRLGALEEQSAALKTWIMRMMWVVLLSLASQLIGPLKLAAIIDLLKAL